MTWHGPLRQIRALEELADGRSIRLPMLACLVFLFLHRIIFHLNKSLNESTLWKLVNPFKWPNWEILAMVWTYSTIACSYGKEHERYLRTDMKRHPGYIVKWKCKVQNCICGILSFLCSKEETYKGIELYLLDLHKEIMKEYKQPI